MTYGLLFASGLAASFHCVGMCGVFPLALARGGLGRQLLYNLGRLTTLLAIGALSGAVGAAVVTRGPVALLEHALAVVAAALMLALGVEMLGLSIGVGARTAALVQRVLRPLLGGVLQSRSAAAPLALGVFNAFLPCQLIYAFAARAASTASVGEGMLTMLAFGLGTVPAMVAVGTAGVALPPVLRARLSLASGLLVVAFGLVTLGRGLGLLAHGSHLH